MILLVVRICLCIVLGLFCFFSVSLVPSAPPLCKINKWFKSIRSKMKRRYHYPFKTLPSPLFRSESLICGNSPHPLTCPLFVLQMRPKNRQLFLNTKQKSYIQRRKMTRLTILETIERFLHTRRHTCKRTISCCFRSSMASSLEA